MGSYTFCETSRRPINFVNKRLNDENLRATEYFSEYSATIVPYKQDLRQLLLIVCFDH